MQQVRGSFSAGDTVADDYLVIGLAGAGGMGVVYRAKDLKLERVVALKFLPPEVDVSSHEKERFLREARTASSLDHPNIGVIHGIEETPDGSTFIIMAFYEGQSLAEKMRSGPLTPAEAVDIAIQVASGLHAAHHHRVVHRDIKPSNVMLAEPVSGAPVPAGVVKIVDFGLAQIMSDRTASGTGIEGTVRYMAPEQSIGGVVDHSADQWALGVVLAEMLTGSHPFESETVGATFAAILNKPPALDGVPVELQRIIYKALAKEPANRYASCEEMRRELEAVRPLLAAAPAAEAPAHSSHWNPISGRSWRTSSAQRERSLASGSSVTIEAERTRGRIAWAIAAVLIVIVLVVGGLLAPRFGAPTPFTAQEKHIAVLPFDNIGNNPENRVLIEGLMDSLAGKLSNLQVGNKQLWVIPSSEVRRRGIAEPGEARRQLGATLVVKGSVQRDGSDVHLNVNLIDARTLRQIGSAELDDPSGDLAALENDAVARLAELMDAAAPAAARSKAPHAGSSSTPVAYEEYLTALAYMERHDKQGNLALAEAALKKAVRIDAGFALGYAQLGEVYRLKYQVDQDPRWLAQAEANCKKAIELDPSLPATYATLGMIHDLRGNHELALEEFQQALKLEPNNVTAMSGLGRSYLRSGRTADAESAYQKAVKLKPQDWETYNSLGEFEQDQHKYSEAIKAYQQALQLTPDNAFVLLNLGGAYADSADPKLASAAEEALHKSIAIMPTYAAFANLGELYLNQHRFEEAASAIRRALAINGRSWPVWNDLLDISLWLHDPARVSEASAHVVALLDQASRTEPGDARLHAYLARAYAVRQEREKSLAEVDTVLTLSPENAENLAILADAYDALGERRAAVKTLTRALRLGAAAAGLRNDPMIQGVLADPAVRISTR